MRTTKNCTMCEYRVEEEGDTGGGDRMAAKHRSGAGEIEGEGGGLVVAE